MAENEERNGSANIPPKLVIKPQGAPGAASPAQGVPPATVRMRPPAPAATSLESQKKTTARIPLSEAVPGGPVAAGGVRTIRLKPATPPPPTVAAPLSRAGSITPPPTPPAAAAETADKRKTSRISLEAVLANEAEPGAAGEDRAPKTIRLKKPSEIATVKVGQSAPLPPVKGDTTTIAEEKVEPKNRTQPITPPAETDESTATRRKTIRVKRPAIGGRVELGEEGGERPATDIARLEEQSAPTEDRPNAFFILSAVAAMLVAMVLIYVLTAQAFGPNSCLTQLSYGAPGLDLAWPGKITIAGGR